jgi:hypothetical protein
MMNQKGFATFAVAILISIVGMILYSSIQNSTASFLSEVFKLRAKIDAEIAIETFAPQLYRAYVYAQDLPETLNGYKYPDVNVGEIKAVPSIGGISLYFPEEICYNRYISTLKDPICIKIPDNFFVKVKNKEEITIVMEPTKDMVEDARLNLEAGKAVALRMLKKIFIEEAEAQVSDPWDPGLGAFSTLPNFTASGNFDAEFQRDYSSFACANTTKVDCLKIKFCVRYKQKCTKDEEFVKQTFVFEKPPKTQLGL